jgi:hypothetical protein
VTGTDQAGLGSPRPSAGSYPRPARPGALLGAPRSRASASPGRPSLARAGSFPPGLEPSRARTRDRDSDVTRYVTLCGVTLGYTYTVGVCSPEQLRALSRGAGVGKPRLKAWHGPCNYPFRQRKRSAPKKSPRAGKETFPPVVS